MMTQLLVGVAIGLVVAGASAAAATLVAWGSINQRVKHLEDGHGAGLREVRPDIAGIKTRLAVLEVRQTLSERRQ